MRFIEEGAGLEESPVSGNPTEFRCNKSTQKLEEEKMLMGVFLFASTVPQSVRAVRACRACFTQLQPPACCFKSFGADSVYSLTSQLRVVQVYTIQNVVVVAVNKMRQVKCKMFVLFFFFHTAAAGMSTDVTVRLEKIGSLKAMRRDAIPLL